jgi:futalosine hydrolase
MDCEGDRLDQITRGRQIVLLTATEIEAEPIRTALSGVDRVEIATKSVYLGELRTATADKGQNGAQGSGAMGAAGIPLVLAVSGCDKVNAAHTLTCLLQAMRPPAKLVLQAGIAGAFQLTSVDADVGAAATEPAASGPEIGDIVLATEEAYSDTGSYHREGWLSAAELGLPIACVDGVETGGVFTLDPDLVEEARKDIGLIDWQGTPPRIHTGVCVTASGITGSRSEADAIAARWGALAESMEGAAAAHVCALHGVPFLEIRGISNMVGEPDRNAWQIERAVGVAARAALVATAAFAARLGEDSVDGTGP